jgi:hypothetical protein
MSRRGKEAVLGVGIVLLIFFLFVTFGFRSATRNKENRAALLQMRELINPGDSYEKVSRVFWEQRTSELWLIAENPSEWMVRMPLEFGASDWTLLITFEEGRVSKVQIRTTDGPPPKEGPEDKEMVDKDRKSDLRR